MRFVADRAYAQLKATAQFCAAGGCGSSMNAQLKYFAGGPGGPSVALWGANTSGLAAIGANYNGTVAGIGPASCNVSSPWSYTATLSGVAAGAVVEFSFAPVGGCNCAAFNQRLVVNGTQATMSPTPTSTPVTGQTKSSCPYGVLPANRTFSWPGTLWPPATAPCWNWMFSAPTPDPAGLLFYLQIRTNGCSGYTAYNPCVNNRVGASNWGTQINLTPAQIVATAGTPNTISIVVTPTKALILNAAGAVTFTFNLLQGFNISQLQQTGPAPTSDTTVCLPPVTSSPTSTPLSATATPTASQTQTGTRTATLSTGASPSQSGAPTATAAPTPGVPVDSLTNFVCSPGGTAKGVMNWGAYAVTNGVTALNRNVWTPFDTCNTGNALVGNAAYYFAATKGASYAHLGNYFGHPQNSGACGYPATGFAAPTVRFTATQAYAALTATASFCPQAACGGIDLAALRYIPTTSSPPQTLWTANSTGTGSSGINFQGLVQGFTGVQYCNTSSWSNYFRFTAELTSVPVGGVVELVIAPGPLGCDCDAFNYRLTVSGTVASFSQTATQSGTASQTQTRTQSATATLSSTQTGTGTMTATASLTAALTSSLTAAATASQTATRTVTPAGTPAGTAAATVSVSTGASASGTPAGSVSASLSGTVSAAQTGSQTGTASASSAQTATPTPSPVSTPSATSSADATASLTATMSVTAGATESATVTPTNSPTAAVTPTVTSGLSPSATQSRLPVSGTMDASDSPEPPSASASISTSPSDSSSATASLSFGLSPSTSPAASLSAAAATPTASQSVGALPPPSSPTATASLSYGASPSATPSAPVSATPLASGDSGSLAAAADASSSGGLIAGAAGGGIAVILGGAAVAVIAMRRRREQRTKLGRARVGDGPADGGGGGGGGGGTGTAAAVTAARDGAAAAFNPLHAARGGGASTARISSSTSASSSARAMAFAPGAAPGSSAKAAALSAAPALNAALQQQASFRAPHTPARAAASPQVHHDGAEAGLPSGWSAVYSDADAAWYWVGPDGSTTWTKPAAAAEPAPAAAEGDLPAGWTEVFSRSRNMAYFRHEASGETLWTRPTM